MTVPAINGHRKAASEESVLSQILAEMQKLSLSNAALKAQVRSLSPCVLSRHALAVSILRFRPFVTGGSGYQFAADTALRPVLPSGRRTLPCKPGRWGDHP
jgi:hypothetical protein